MFRYSLKNTIGDIRNHERLPFDQNSLLFVPSNAIIPLNNSPIIFENSIFVKNWGFREDESSNSSNIITNITLDNAISNSKAFQNCLIPLNGYFINSQFHSIFRYSKEDQIIFSAGVLTDNDSFLFVTTMQNQVDNGDILLPLILSNNEDKQCWLSKQFEHEFISAELCDRLVSNLSLNNSSYNGDRCLEEYFPFQLHTNTLNIAKEEYLKFFGKNPNWFDEF